MTDELMRAVEIIIASLPVDERENVDRERLVAYLNKHAHAGETDVAAMILAGTSFVRLRRLSSFD